jgi:hypothetical protein
MLPSRGITASEGSRRELRSFVAAVAAKERAQAREQEPKRWRVRFERVEFRIRQSLFERGRHSPGGFPGVSRRGERLRGVLGENRVPERRRRRRRLGVVGARRVASAAEKSGFDRRLRGGAAVRGPGRGRRVTHAQPLDDVHQRDCPGDVRPLRVRERVADVAAGREAAREIHQRGPRFVYAQIEIGLLRLGFQDAVLRSGEPHGADEPEGVQRDERDVPRAARLVKLGEGLHRYAAGDDDGEGGEKVGILVDDDIHALVHERAGHGRVELVQVRGDRGGAPFAQVGLVHEEVVPQVPRRDQRVVHQRERVYPAEHQVLDRLHARRATVQQTHLARLETSLAVLAPDAQLAVVPPALGFLHACRCERAGRAR